VKEDERLVMKGRFELVEIRESEVDRVEWEFRVGKLTVENSTDFE
jgi:hypothetical protein